MTRKTKLMAKIEACYHQPLEELLPDMYNEKGLPTMATELGVSKGTIWYWLMKFGINVRRVAVCPGEDLKVVHRKRHPSKDKERAA